MSATLPDFESFKRLAARHNRVPVVATLLSDSLTPVSVFARLEQQAERAFLLESVVGGERVARYSFLGTGPARTCEVVREQVRWMDHATGRVVEQEQADPLASLAAELRRYNAPTLPGLPKFLGGAIGYAGYDTARYYEPLPAAPEDDRHLPDLLFDIYETLVVFDHVHKVVHVVSHAEISDGASGSQLQSAYDAAGERIAATIAKFSGPLPIEPTQVALPVAPLTRYTSNFTPDGFERVVERCQEHIRAGDIFQVVPSQRLHVQTAADPLHVYRALRVINPSPFMFLYKSPSVTLVGASPEIMCRVADGVVTNRPLAGTRPRGAMPAEDEQLQAELLADPKERAEHIMLVDLGRNDVGRVSQPGSVRLHDVMVVEYYSHVMHIASTVTGQLRPELSALDALRATLPVGTVTGAPKVRAMQIIDECEPTRRGPYAGALGHINFAGNMDTCITLRTLVMQPAGGGRLDAYVQVGAGVVADSVPQREYQETINKAQGLLSALALAESALS